MWKMFIIRGRLFMRGPRGVGTGVWTTPFLMKMHKAVNFFKNTALPPPPPPCKLQSYVASVWCRAIIDPLARRHLNGVSLVG